MTGMKSLLGKQRLMGFCVAMAVGFAGQAALADQLDIDMGFFPKGTECVVFGTKGKVTKRTTRKEIKFKIRGDTRSVGVECRLPNGNAYRVDTAPFVRKDTDYTILQLNADNRGVVLWDAGGIKTLSIEKFLRKR